jgi:hypothetical protein
MPPTSPSPILHPHLTPHPPFTTNTALFYIKNPINYPKHIYSVQAPIYSIPSLLFVGNYERLLHE